MKKKILICVLGVMAALCFGLFTACLEEGGEESHEHTLVYHESVEATCTEDGAVEYYECEYCGKIFADSEAQTELYSVIISAGHSYGEGVVTKEATCTEEGCITYTCSVCGDTYTEEIAVTDHSYESVVTASTCTKEGYTTHICTICGYNYRDNFTEPLGHNYEAVVTAPTCTVEGYTTYTCKECGDSYTEEIAATGHNYESEVTDATCTEEGYTTYTCSKCGDSYVSDYTEATGHSYEITSDTSGHWYVCSVCGEETEIEEHVYNDAGFCSVCGADVNQLTYSLNSDNETYSVTGISSLVNTDLVIPSTYNGLPVTKIGASAFLECSTLTSVVIPEGVTSIGSYAFYGCSSLTSVEIPEGVTSIGSYAFFCCTSLTSVEMQEGMTSIGSFAFYFCSSLTSVEIPEGVTFIGSYAFTYCTSLTSVVIPEGVTTIESYAFCYCSSLTSVEIPEGVTTIESDAFSYCSGLTSVEIPEGVTAIGEKAFYYCKKLSSVSLPDTLTEIESYAFWDCYVLTDIILPEKLESIGSYAFANCYRLTEIIIPDSVATIGLYAFAYCGSLTTVTLGSGVTTIKAYAFYKCTELVEVYYKGTPDEWDEIEIGTENTYLESASIYYYSETEPTDTEYSYWYYDDSGEIVIWEVILTVSTWTGLEDVYTEGYTVSVSFTLTFYSDSTAELICSVSDTEMTVATLIWSLSESDNTIYFEDSSNGEFSDCTIWSDGIRVTWSGDISDSMTGITVTLSGDVDDFSALQAVETVEEEVTEVAGTTEVSVWTGTANVYLSAYDTTISSEFTLTFYSDFTAELIVSVSGSEMTVATLTWSLSESGYTIYFEDSSNGEFSDFTLSSDGMSVVWSGDISDSMIGVTVTLTGDVNDLSALQAVEAVEEEVTEVTTFTGETTFTVSGYEMTSTFTLTFYSDYSVELVCSAMGSEMTAATATWSMPSTYSLSISDSSNGEFGDCTLSSDGITVTWSGDVNESMTEIEVTLASADDLSTTFFALWTVA